jgi:hypothetical protein
VFVCDASFTNPLCDRRLTDADLATETRRAQSGVVGGEGELRAFLDGFLDTLISSTHLLD